MVCTTKHTKCAAHVAACTLHRAYTHNHLYPYNYDIGTLLLTIQQHNIAHNICLCICLYLCSLIYIYIVHEELLSAVPSKINTLSMHFGWLAANCGLHSLSFMEVPNKCWTFPYGIRMITHKHTHTQDIDNRIFVEHIKYIS